MKSQDVADYLLENPKFFEEQGDLITRLELPHPHDGRAISITERQVLALREKNRYLEKKLGEWLLFGRENDAIGEKIHRLSVAVIAAPDIQALVRVLDACLRDEFEILQVAIRLWERPENVEDLPEFGDVSETLRAFIEMLPQPHCGATAGFETASLFGEAAQKIRSQALIALRANGSSIGFIALGSEDARHYYNGMGTLYLERLGEIASAAFARILRYE